MEIKILTRLHQDLMGGLLPPPIQGFSVDELACLEAHLNVRLPQVFREFLYLFGKQNYGNPFMRYKGPDQLIQMQEDVRRLFSGLGADLAKPFFAYIFFEDEQVVYFYYDEGDNPPVYRFELQLFLEEKQQDGLPRGVVPVRPSFGSGM